MVSTTRAGGTGDIRSSTWFRRFTVAAAVGRAQPPYERSPHEQPPPYGPPAYGPPSYGQVPPYGLQPYVAAPPYGQASPYGQQPPYGQAPYGQPGPVHPGMLAAAADRERTMDVLKAAFGEGRITKEEFDLRASRTMSARTYAQLGAVVADLPSGPRRSA